MARRGHEAAYAAVDGVVREAQARQTLPRLTDPQAGPVLRDFWSLDAVLGRPPYGLSDVQPLGAVLLRQNAVLRLYNRLAIRVARGVPADQQDSITPAEMFLDEQCYALAAMLYVMDANFAALVDVWARLPAEQRTVQQQRFAVVYDLAHDNLPVAPDMLATPGVSPGSATRLDGALRDTRQGLLAR